MAKAKPEPKKTDAEERKESIQVGVDLWEDLLYAVDGGNNIDVGQYEASTFMALVEDEDYRTKVLAEHERQHG